MVGCRLGGAGCYLGDAGSRLGGASRNQNLWSCVLVFSNKHNVSHEPGKDDGGGEGKGRGRRDLQLFFPLSSDEYWLRYEKNDEG